MKRFIFWFSLALNVVFIIGAGLSVGRLGGIRPAWSRLVHRELPALYRHRVSLFERLPVKKNAVVFLGDSQTEQAEWHELCNTPTWVALNRGIAGDGVSGVLSRVDEVMRHQPRMVFLQIGINDLLLGAHPEAVAEQYDLLVQRIRSANPGTQLVIQSVLPVNENFRYLATDNRRISTLNENLQRIAERHALPYVDLYTPVVDAGGRLSAEYTTDGVHLNGDGYRVWMQTIMPFIPKE